MLSVEVRFLDESVANFQIQYKATGNVLFDQACKMLNLLEVDYFGLEYADSNNTKYWLDQDKPMCRQLGLSLVNPVMYFRVKFYTPDPAHLEEEYTRYLFSLQIKQDLAQGALQCNDNTAALIASYIVQADCGDYSLDDYPDHTYLSSFKFVPHQDDELERKIMENHKKHAGQSPSEADMNLLETARRCELYGIKMTPAKDHDGVPLNLAVAHMGILVFQHSTKITTFSWAKIRKLSFKRRRFIIKLHPEGSGFYKDAVEFFFEGRNSCKNFWKKGIENHGFFRCSEVRKLPRQRARIFSRGSSFRYSGRTQKQITEFVRENFVKRQPFQSRSTSLRIPSTSRRSVGNSVLGQPLLPVTSSQSCGSVALNDSGPIFTASEPRPISASQPSSPRTIQEPERMAINGTVYSEEKERPARQRDFSSGLESPDFEYDKDGLYSPDAIGHDTDDNLSHDSYHLEEHIVGLESPYFYHSSTKGNVSPTSCRDGSTVRSEASFSLCVPSSTDDLTQSPITPMKGVKNGSDLLASPETNSEKRKQKTTPDIAYFIAKELLMTERKYKKELELINIWFREEVSKEENMPTEVLALLFSILDPLYEFHCGFLRDLEQRLSTWEGKGGNTNHTPLFGIGDIFFQNIHITELYDRYLEKLPLVLERISSAYKYNQHFEQIYRDFELQKACYLPLSYFLLAPAYRLTLYCAILQRLVDHYEEHHPDQRHCKIILIKLQQVTASYKETVKAMENYVKLMDLHHEMVGIDDLQQPSREFIREGCLQKLSRKGYQQRMFFLFSDMLLYASRSSNPRLQFKVHRQLPLESVMVEETEPKMGMDFCFTVYGGNQALMVAASCEEERQKWLTDLIKAIDCARDQRVGNFLYSSLHSCSSSDELLDKIDGQRSLFTPPAQPEGGSTNTSEKQAQHRATTTVHVCWHRSMSVGIEDFRQSMVNQLSGYLLRKFKNSSGWQKLWVVLANFCLFFYKSYQDDFPLASLPLMGYQVTTPNEQDNINKDCVFKLQFKNHVYFFRAESQYTFSRWVEVTENATLHHISV
ncbi:FERM, RhoGEF and pleckstrin domain-containing protein 2-like isoform X1 [Limulus polyphemus]|uniref:Moesin/ezrin/radixin homolog 1 n=1 Tax=Limulus polyphemus TaxID=6850 RepID=A0ABM1S709_LIMPO|nr:FERM, RhoGEF and pleckstrin domain-containing protein 2-like isoform X1 [Limulus polyphemus]XP_022239415.1 FERM, RhoGEF and pleckstrin domain-containing protein 2-like isoform X1 [Limulus polyphemus]